MSPNDAKQVRRIVGFLEYGMALGYFQQLLQKTTSEQQAELEEFVGDHESFRLFTHLARRVQPAQTTLASYPTDDTKPGKRREGTLRTSSASSSLTEQTERTGLSWAMALARIELASILAAFTEMPDPFVNVRPTEFELPAYKELLLDGVATHYWTLARDPAVKRVTKISPSNPAVLAYTRRLSLSRKMLRGLAKAAVGDFMPVQYRELSTWNRDLDRLHLGLLMAIEDYLATITRQSTEQGEKQREFVRACQQQLRGERSELRRGTAKVYNFGSSSSEN